MKRQGSARRHTKRSLVHSMRIFVTTFMGVFFGLFLGISYSTLSSTKENFSYSIVPPNDLTYIEDKYSFISAHILSDAWYSMRRSVGGILPHGYNVSKIWVPTNPQGAERLPSGIVVSETELNPRRVWGLPSEDLTIKTKYLVTFTVGVNQKNNIDAAVKKFSDNFTIMLFHYDGWTTEWEEFEWSKRAIHVSVQKQSKWWYSKRFLHPDIVASYEYIFIWDEDLGLEHFDAEEYIRLVRKHNLHISQPGLDPESGFTWEMTKRREGSEVHKEADETAGWCRHPHLPPCAAFVEIMATVFSRDAWRCVWYMLQNDLVHGWGLDFALRKCVEPAHEKIGVVDSQWIVHKGIPTLNQSFLTPFQQGKAENGKKKHGVRRRCIKEWGMFHQRILSAEIKYYKSKGMRVVLYNSTSLANPPNSSSLANLPNSTAH